MDTLNHITPVDYDAAVNFRNTLIRIIRAALGLPETVAVPMADELARELAKEAGGLYITKREVRGARDAAVLRDFNGRNHRETCRKHNISRATLYRIVGERAAKFKGEAFR